LSDPDSRNIQAWSLTAPQIHRTHLNVSSDLRSVMHHATLHCYPCLTYADPDAALVFLREAFDFVPLVVHRDAEGRVAHAEVVRGSVALMIGPPRAERGWAAASSLPQRHASLYVAMVAASPHEVDALCARAWEAGAVVTRPPEDTPYGTREFTVRDPEGQEWHVGNYHPLADASAEVLADARATSTMPHASS
jgi:uncharacterized glyoxalase superfamily protein PhnB